MEIINSDFNILAQGGGCMSWTRRLICLRLLILRKHGLCPGGAIRATSTTSSYSLSQSLACLTNSPLCVRQELSDSSAVGADLLQAIILQPLIVAATMSNNELFEGSTRSNIFTNRLD